MNKIAKQLIAKQIKKQFKMDLPFEVKDNVNSFLIITNIGEFIIDKLSLKRDIRVYKKYKFTL